MKILKYIYKLIFDTCECGCTKEDFSTKKSFCPCGCDLQPVTREAEIDLKGTWITGRCFNKEHLRDYDDGLSGEGKIGI